MIACGAFSFASQMAAAREADNQCKYAQQQISQICLRNIPNMPSNKYAFIICQICPAKNVPKMFDFKY